MSRLDDAFAELCRPLLKEQFGETVSWEEPDGTTSQAIAIVGDERTEEDLTADGRSYRRQREITLFKDDVAAPSIGGKATIGGEIWQAESITTDGSGRTILELVRIGTAEISRPGYRRSAR